MTAGENAADASPRDRLLDAGRRLLASGGPEALQARKLAAEIGASTMAVYTHFGGIPELLQALARDGFSKLSQRLERVSKTEDATADLFRLALAYRAHALEHPELYRVMFGLAGPGGCSSSRDMTKQGAPTALVEGRATYYRLIAAVARVLASGRCHAAEPVQIAAQMWSALHGYVLLEIAGFFGADGHGVEHVLVPLAVNLVVAFGDTREAAARSVQLAATCREAR